MPTTLPISTQTLPVGICPATINELLVLFGQNMFVALPDTGGRQWVFSAAKPADTSVGWWRLDSLGRPERKYLFAQGAWLALHPLVPGLTQWWFNTLPDFTTFDGGDANPISSLSGPMWEQAKTPNGTVIAAKFPIVAGTLPSGKVLSVGDTGGVEQITLSEANLPPHKHLEAYRVGSGGAGVWWDDSNDHESAGFGSENLSAVGAPNGVQPYTSSVGGSGDEAQAVDSMGPYCVGYLLSRTNRLFYSIT